MEITGWVAIAILVFMGGQTAIVHHSEVLKDQKTCEAIQKEALAGVKDIEGLIAVGVSCTPVKVKEIPNPKMPQKPKPPETTI